ncbi:MAG: NAD(P)-dependent oxidoreductase [Acidimicrobiia bacterium]|nr:NAD(P)-dependent oxidoreductase [Acidimicrobiia bacterium]
MKVLIADKFSETHLQQLTDLGHEVSFQPTLADETLRSAVPGFDVLVVRSTRVDAATIDAATSLSLIIRAGAGVNTIDVDRAAEQAVFVCNTPGKNAVAVAELVMGLILSIDRNIPDQVADIRAGTWNKTQYSKTNGLAGRSLGIVGLGSIGLEVARRARSFEMEVSGTDADPGRQVYAEAAGVGWVPDLMDLVAASDVVTFHVPAIPQTENLVSAELLAAMKPGAMIINSSRGNIVDEDALLKAMDEKGIRAGVDVYKGEPGSGVGSFESPLAQHPNVYGTHHIGASTEQAQGAIADAVIATLAAFGDGELVNCVNLSELLGTELTVTVRHVNKVGVLAGVLATLRGAGLNVENMENFVLKGRKASSAVIHVVGDVSDGTLNQIEEQDGVIGVSLTAR